MSFSAVCYRCSAWETPVWSFPNTVAGRWNPARSWPAQYLALHPMTPWAEQLRNLNLRNGLEARSMRIPIWAIRITLETQPTRVVFADAASFGVRPSDLVDDDRSECQRLAGELRATGITSVIVPSAALPGTENLVIFDPAVVIDYQQDPVDPIDVPGALLAQDGRCPEGLWDLVHYSAAGVLHPSLQAFEAGDEFEFVQPLVSRESLSVV